MAEQVRRRKFPKQNKNTLRRIDFLHQFSSGGVSTRVNTTERKDVKRSRRRSAPSDASKNGDVVFENLIRHGVLQRG